MHCRTCDYPLWNLRTRECPECGSPFKPGEYTFAPGRVRFCCPHCGKAYYGTGHSGHLHPAGFACVQCRQAIVMDEMVLLPGEGVDDVQTRVDRVPWLEPRRGARGFIGAWVRTSGLAMIAPIRLGSALPAESPPLQAWLFALLTWALYMSTAIALPTLVIGVILFANNEDEAAGFLIAAVATPIVGPAAMCALIAGWGALAHGVLRLTGETRHSLGRTFEAICYSSGAAVIMAVPFMGFYCLLPFGALWWVICAVLAVAAAQNVHGGRAALAVLAAPALLVLVGVIAYVVMMTRLIGAAGFAATGFPGTPGVAPETQFVGQAYIDAGLPQHAGSLVADGWVGTDDFVLSWTETYSDQIPIGAVDLMTFASLPPEAQQAELDAAIDALPDDVVAHRLGDFVFTGHGIDPAQHPGTLWVMIESPDPDANAPAFQFTVVLLDGTTTQIPRSIFMEMLRVENGLREREGLPPLPHPEGVKHDAPARAGPPGVPDRE